MKNLGSEVGQFCRLIKTNHADTVRIRTDIRVGGHHAVDVCPNFDSFGTQSCPDDCGGEIGSTPSNGGGDPGPSRSDESSHHRDTVVFEQRVQSLLKPSISLFKLRHSTSMGVVSDDALP